MGDKKYELKIESEIGGGSLSILKNAEILYKREQILAGKKSDFIIEILKDSLALNHIEIENLETIKYSDYPGSQMGLKILASIIKGMSVTNEINVSSGNILDSIIECYKVKINGDFCVVLPVNERNFVLKLSENGDSEPIAGQSMETLSKTLENFIDDGIKILLPVKIFERMNDKNNKSDLIFLRNSKSFIDTGDNLSIYL